MYEAPEGPSKQGVQESEEEAEDEPVIEATIGMQAHYAFDNWMVSCLRREQPAGAAILLVLASLPT